MILIERRISTKINIELFCIYECFVIFATHTYNRRHGC